ncbi:DUF6053 domain-containing protein [Lysobacter enzymogenes]
MPCARVAAICAQGSGPEGPGTNERPAGPGVVGGEMAVRRLTAP